MAQRVLQQSARRIASKQAVPFNTSRLITPSTSLLQIRPATIDHGKATTIRQDEGMTILEHQRLQRPVAPHLTIYKPQITWLASGLNRNMGLILSGSLYIFGLGYAIAPLIGLKWGSAAFAAGVAKWPVWAKMATKTFFAFPFSFHSINGLRHLIWDTGSQITNKQVIWTGWTAVGLSTVATAALVMFV